MREPFTSTKFSPQVLAKIEAANAIIAEHAALGLVLTVRQVYYQFVARDLIPNTLRSYKNLASALNDGRMAGLIDWDAIEDRTRGVNIPAAWATPLDVTIAAQRAFQTDLWADQPYRPEVWIEKEALAGVAGKACRELRVPLLACRGYLSQSEAYVAGQRLREHLDGGQQPIVFHLGDHDPSGIDMTRDNDKRLATFIAGHEDDVRPWYAEDELPPSGLSGCFKRIALTMDQIEALSPPPNPAKMTDARFGGYASRYGDSSWELDALPPAYIDNLIRTEILAVRDEALWEKAMKREAALRRKVDKIVAFARTV